MGLPVRVALILGSTREGRFGETVARWAAGRLALRLVFAELHAATMRDGVGLPMAWNRFDKEGQPVDPDGVNRALDVMVDQLLWWALALDEAKAERAYGRPHG